MLSNIKDITGHIENNVATFKFFYDTTNTLFTRAEVVEIELIAYHD